ncbi:MAG: hypothetical protein MSG64_09075 [Pyrinomonadaceae bacterium MAG19_C2-C3]|nr:hypothetical protein [Pyrinomonadaceae bacterium MAG19_C2-C3]
MRDFVVCLACLSRSGVHLPAMNFSAQHQADRTKVFKQSASRIYDSLLAVLYPMRCACCGGNVECRADLPACDGCWKQTWLFGVGDLMCWKCGAPAPGGTVARRAVPVDERVRCGRCDDEAWTVARSVGAYDGALKAAVLSLKREPYTGGRLIEAMAVWGRIAPLNEATRVMGVPLHPTRKRERGFNQAAILAARLATSLALPFDDASLVRTKYAQQQRAGMDAQARLETTAGAFTVSRPRLIKGERILLVDDVWTTGATAAACARALCEAEAADVFVLTIARAGVHSDV